MPKVVPRHWPHRDSYAILYEGDHGDHYFTPLPHKMSLTFFTIPQTYITRYPIIGDEFLHCLFRVNQFFKPTHP